MANSGNPAARFYNWNFINSANGTLSVDDLWGSATLAGLAWENGTFNGAMGTQRQTCRHAMTHVQFLPGTKLQHATIPCIVVHSITWPTETIPRDVQYVLDDSRVVSLAGRSEIRGGTPGVSLIYDASNHTLPTSPVVGGNLAHASETVIVAESEYPEPFIWKGSMTSIVYMKYVFNFPPYVADPFGIEELYNHITRGTTMLIDKGKVQPAQTYTYLQINFTAGVINPATSTYVKQSVVEGDDNDQEWRDILPAPWVREALYLTTDIMACLAQSNMLGFRRGKNLEGYIATNLRFSYMAAWSHLQRSYEPNSTELVVELFEQRLQAIVTLWRVIVWLSINALFTVSWPVIWLLRKRNQEVTGVDGVTDFILRLYTSFERTE